MTGDDWLERRGEDRFPISFILSDAGRFSKNKKLKKIQMKAARQGRNQKKCLKLKD
jgi:hypothetical protein